MGREGGRLFWSYHEVCDSQCSIAKSTVIGINSSHQTQTHTHYHAKQERERERGSCDGHLTDT